ncbi:hypothetical protein [Clostridium butyricum]
MYNKVLNIELKRNNNKAMSTWEIQEFIGKLINNYYKIDLLNEIAKMINSEVELENIFILDKSFDYKNRYTYLATTDIINLNQENGAKNFYHLGSPIGLFPSKRIIEMNAKMQILRIINNYLHSKRIERIDKNNINILLEIDFVKAVEIMKMAAFNVIKDNFQIDEDIRVYCRELDNKIKEEIKNVESYSSKECEINDLKRKIVKNETFELTNKESELFNEYFHGFNKTLIKYDRPIVGIYDYKTSSVQILCKSYIHKKTRDSRFLDLKKFTHNSPTFVDMCSGVAMAIPMLPMIKGIKQSINNKASERELDERELNIVNRFDNIIEMLDETMDKAELDSVDNIQNSIINKEFTTINEELVKKMNSNLAEYDFNNENINIKIIDFNENKKRRKNK